ncbi:phage tail protein [Cyclobacterium marinum]|uniref:phage tail protein n=1 Tax=Cyclobacterium marinum TaxID=104 RepID=UPI0011EDE3B4|nr:phage tail protein [Cyclobacterium marinum]MBI0399952.1 phage tail protein [Cyclobacterium marinum]
MAGEKQDSVWPQPKCYFRVKFETLSETFSFQEISGLDPEVAYLEYRKSESKSISAFKLPGKSKLSNVTLRKGVFSDAKEFYNWFNSVKVGTARRENVIIELLDESGNPSMTWSLSNAWVSKATGFDLNSNTEEVAIETIELVYEGLTIITK